jgi:hypothetical protein
MDPLVGEGEKNAARFGISVRGRPISSSPTFPADVVEGKHALLLYEPPTLDT